MTFYHPNAGEVDHEKALISMLVFPFGNNSYGNITQIRPLGRPKVNLQAFVYQQLRINHFGIKCASEAGSFVTPPHFPRNNYWREKQLESRA